MSYKRFTTSCLQCKREIMRNNFAKHIDSKSCKKEKTQKAIDQVCKYCLSSFSRLSSHERCCKLNPERIKRKGTNQFTKAKELGKEYIVSDSTRQKIRNSNIGRKHTEETKKQISNSMKLVVKENPESYSGGYNRGRVKSLLCSNGFNVLGEWERSFVEYCVEHNIKIEQPNVGFSYQWNGNRTYFPDFYLPETDQWVEIKGLQTERDLAKWDSIRNIHKKNLLVLSGGIDQIRTDICAIMSDES